MVSLSSKGTTSFRVIGMGRIKAVLSSIFLKKRLVTVRLILAVFYLPPLVLKFQILVKKFERQLRVSCVSQHHLAQLTHTSVLWCLPYLVALESDSCSILPYFGC